MKELYDPTLLTISQLAKFLGVNTTTIWNQIKLGWLLPQPQPAARLRGVLAWEKADLVMHFARQVNGIEELLRRARHSVSFKGTPRSEEELRAFLSVPAEAGVAVEAVVVIDSPSAQESTTSPLPSVSEVNAALAFVAHAKTQFDLIEQTLRKCI